MSKRKKKNEIVEVEKSNAAARAQWKTTSVWEGRVLAIAALKVKADANIERVRIQISELIKGTGAGVKKREKTKEEIRKALKKAIGKHITLYDPSNDETTYTVIYRQFKINKTEGWVEVLLEENLKAQYLSLTGNYTRYNLQEYMQLQSIYSQRMYEFLSSWRHYKGELEFSLSYLHNMLQVPKSMIDDFAEFRKHVLERAHKDIHAIKNVSFTYEWYEIRASSRGRPVTKIRIVFGEEAAEISEDKKNRKKEKTRRKNEIPKQEKSAAVGSDGQGQERTQQLLPFNEDEASVGTPSVFSHDLEAAVKGWIDYRKYKSRAAITKFWDVVKENAKIYSDDAIIKVINLAMSNGYMGVVWEKIEKKSVRECPKEDLNENAEEIIDKAELSSEVKKTLKEWVIISNCNVENVVKQVQQKARILDDGRIIDVITWAIEDNLHELQF